MGLSAFKKVAKKKKTTKKKDDKPEIRVTGPLVGAHVKFLQGKKKEKDGKAIIKMSEGLLLPFAKKEHAQACQDNDKYFSSIKLIRKIEGDDTEHSLTVSFANKYSEIDSENEDDLREIYGELYDTYFKEQTKVALSEIALNDDAFTNKLIEFVGEDNFEKYFDVKNFIKPTPEYHEARVRNSDLAELHKQAEDADLVRCNKPSIKQ